MTISFETLSKFMREQGAVTIIDTSGKYHVLRSGDPDVIGVIEKADRSILFPRRIGITGEHERTRHPSGY
jgi:hypothetical protein